MANRPKRQKEKFYHLRITKSAGPYLDYSCERFTDDPLCFWVGNAAHAKATQAKYPLAWIMEKVPSLHRQVKP